MNKLFVLACLAVLVTLTLGQMGGGQPRPDGDGDGPGRGGMHNQTEGMMERKRPGEGEKSATGAKRGIKHNGKSMRGTERGGVKIGSDEKGLEYGVAGIYEHNSTGGIILSRDGTGGMKEIEQDEFEEEEIMYSADDSNNKVKGMCQETEVTLHTEVSYKTTTCTALGNGTITLGSGDAQETMAITEGDVKVVVEVDYPLFCGDNNGDTGADCDGQVGTGLCLTARMRSPKGRKPKDKGNDQAPGNRVGPKNIEFGEDGKGPKLKLATMVECVSEDGTSTWMNLEELMVAEDDTVEEGDDGTMEKAKGKFCFPRCPGGKSKIIYDPMMAGLDGIDEDGDYTSTGASAVGSFCLSILTAMILLLLH